MTANQSKHLRVMVIILLVFLAIQFEFGMAVNLSDLPSIPSFSFTLASLFGALNQAGLVAMVHALLGTILVFISIVNLVMSLAAKIRSIQVFGVLAFLTLVLAGVCGVLFVLSGFQNANYSHGMATNFLLTFGFYFLELYLLKPNQGLKPQ